MFVIRFILNKNLGIWQFNIFFKDLFNLNKVCHGMFVYKVYFIKIKVEKFNEWCK